MKKWLIISVVIFIIIGIVIFSKPIITYFWESSVNSNVNEDKEFDKSKENIQKEESRLQICEVLYPEDCNDETEIRLKENCLACEAAGQKKIAPKNDTSVKIGRAASSEEQKSAPPVIKNLGVNFADYNSETKKAGDFLFTITPTNNKILGEFGQKVSGSKLLPHYTYYIPKNTPIMAVADGEVIAIWYQEGTKDYEIHVKPVYDSYWDINYDHVINPVVKENNTIKAGSLIGYSGDFTAPLEISVESEKEIPGTFYPLFSYFETSLKQEYEKKVWKLISDWETYKNDKNIYDENAMTACPACLVSALADNYKK